MGSEFSLLATAETCDFSLPCSLEIRAAVRFLDRSCSLFENCMVGFWGVFLVTFLHAFTQQRASVTCDNHGSFLTLGGL